MRYFRDQWVYALMWIMAIGMVIFFNFIRPDLKPPPSNDAECGMGGQKYDC